MRLQEVSGKDFRCIGDSWSQETKDSKLGIFVPKLRAGGWVADSTGDTAVKKTDMVTLLNEDTILQDGLPSPTPPHPHPRPSHWQEAESQRRGGMLHILPRRRHSAPSNSGTTLLAFVSMTMDDVRPVRQLQGHAALDGRLAQRLPSPSAFHPRSLRCLILLLLLTIWSSDLIYMTLEVTEPADMICMIQHH